MNSGGAVRAVFTPVGFRDKHSPALRTAFQIPVPVNLCFQRPVQRQDRPAEPFAADGECEHLRTDTGVAIIQRKAVAVVTVAALPAYQAVGPLPLRRGHAIGGTVRLVFPAAASLYRGYPSCVPSILLSVAVLPEKASCPIPAACSGVVALTCSGHGVQKQGHGALPQPGYSFSDGHLVFKGLVHRW